MSVPLSTPPERHLWSGEDRLPPGPPHDGGGSGGGPGRRDRPPGRLAALLAITALLGGGVGAGLVAATGLVGGDSTHTTTTVIHSGSAVSATSSRSGLDASALYASTSPGVVDITAKGVSTSSSSDQSSPFGTPQQSETTATGTGFVVDAQGHIVTASHVVNGASSITVTFQGGTTRKATVLGQDDATDVAVLKVDPSGLNLHPLTLGSSASVGVGDEIAAIGDPFGYARSISTGIVSGVDRTVQAPNGFTVAHAIQTDAALNPGNSGGPVLDSAGRVIGIVDQIATNGSADQSSGVGFAVPIDLVRSELSALESGKTVSHAYLGVATSDATGSTGATLATVTSGGPAAAAGLRAGDVVTKLGDATVGDPNDLVAAIATHQPGDQVAVTVRRGSRTVQATVKLGTQPAQSSSGG